MVGSLETYRVAHVLQGGSVAGCQCRRVTLLQGACVAG